METSNGGGQPELEQEAKAINKLISEEEFTKYFRTKDELTKSLPLWRHIGHYKTMINNEVLTILITAMLNIGL